MAYYTDLLAQAKFLATREKWKPLQSSLRRAVSAAYYSLFHMLIEDATRQMLGTSRSMLPFRRSLARAFDHNSMAEASKSFAGGSLPRGIALVVGAVAIPTDLRKVASAFVTLQQERHRADYNLALPFQRLDVIALLKTTEEAAEAWARVRNEEIAQFFLTALALWKRFHA